MHNDKKDMKRDITNNRRKQDERYVFEHLLMVTFGQSLRDFMAYIGFEIYVYGARFSLTPSKYYRSVFLLGFLQCPFIHIK